METRTERQPGGRLALLLVLAVVLLIRLPFLNQAVQGDDVYYLAEAEHAQIDPLHPTHFRYVFLGDMVDMRGHPHPPLNAWFLGLLLAVLKDIREVPFHAVYILFSIVAALSMWSLAKRFSPHPLWATLLFLAVPAFVVNGNSFESDLPFLAFWMAGVALFAAGRYRASAVALALAALAAYQAIFATPILWWHVWLFERRKREAWAVTLVPPATLALWQVLERLSTGALPASVLEGYLSAYDFESLVNKLSSVAALTGHACFLVFPALIPGAAMLAWKKRREPDTLFLLGWTGLFLAAALAVFFAGSARYLLPVAAPVALLASRLRRRWLAAGFGIQMGLSLMLATVNYQHWDGYRQFAASLPTADRRVWINADWGLRYYLEAAGGLALQHDQPVRPGDLVVSSELFSPVGFHELVAPVAQREIRPGIPLRLIGLDTHSGYSTSSKGLLPFGVSSGPIDRVRAEVVVERHPTLAFLPMNAPEAAQQIVSGIYDLEGAVRWMSGQGVVLLKNPALPATLEANFHIPAPSPVRHVRLFLNGQQAAELSCPAPGIYRISTSRRALSGSESTVSLIADKTFTAPPDRRILSVVLISVGFK
jgi:hypothetical protein